MAGVHKQIELTHQAFDAQVPCFGSCWGLQILVKAAGGDIQLNPRGLFCGASCSFLTHGGCPGREYGVGRKISLTPEGRAHPMFEGKKATFDAWISHSDEVVHMPSTVINLGGNDHSRVQAIAANINGCEHWAVQYHPVIILLIDLDISVRAKHDRLLWQEYSLSYIAQMTISRTERLMKMGFFPSEEALHEYARGRWPEARLAARARNALSAAHSP